MAIYNRFYHYDVEGSLGTLRVTVFDSVCDNQQEIALVIDFCSRYRYDK